VTPTDASPPVRAVAVFCGSSQGSDPAFADGARHLGAVLAQRGVELVYGGGRVGLMGVVADAVLDGGGRVRGVITRSLADREVAHTGLTELQVVETMHQRKASMADAADAFVMLPGGLGTLDEFFEAVTWTQLGVHAKPCAILDMADYFAPLLSFLDAATEKGLLRAEHRAMVLVEQSPEALLDHLSTWVAPPGERWLTRDER
jgi:uncharacterized protein (TIGR00730 family)